MRNALGEGRRRSSWILETVNTTAESRLVERLGETDADLLVAQELRPSSTGRSSPVSTARFKGWGARVSPPLQTEADGYSGGAAVLARRGVRMGVRHSTGRCLRGAAFGSRLGAQVRVDHGGIRLQSRHLAAGLLCAVVVATQPQRHGRGGGGPASQEAVRVACRAAASAASSRPRPPPAPHQPPRPRLVAGAPRAVAADGGPKLPDEPQQLCGQHHAGVRTADQLAVAIHAAALPCRPILLSISFSLGVLSHIDAQ